MIGKTGEQKFLYIYTYVLVCVLMKQIVYDAARVVSCHTGLMEFDIIWNLVNQS